MSLWDTFFALVTTVMNKYVFFQKLYAVDPSSLQFTYEILSRLANWFRSYLFESVDGWTQGPTDDGAFTISTPCELSAQVS